MRCLTNLKTELYSLAVFRDFLQDSVICALCNYLENPSVSAYSEFAAQLYNANGGKLDEYVRDICENNENVYVRTVGRGEKPSELISLAAHREIQTLQKVSDLTPESLRAPLTWQGFLPQFSSGSIKLEECFLRRVNNIGKYGYGIYAKNRMFYVEDDGSITPVKNPDTIRLSELVDYEAERKIVYDNTLALIKGLPAANLLLTGDAGTGKSSTIKAVGNELYGEGLRIIEVKKHQLCAIQRILDELSENPLKFVLFIDDLSFLKDDDNFNALKAVLEGSVSAKSNNVVIYATSNRRHIIKENFSDRDGDEVHRNDTLQELVSLSERFGLRVNFQKPDKNTFLNIVHQIAQSKGVVMPKGELELKAERFALERGARSARLAKQFIDNILSSAVND